MRELFIFILVIFSVNAFSQSNLRILSSDELKEIEEINTLMKFVSSVDDPSQLVSIVHDQNKDDLNDNIECNDPGKLKGKEKRQWKREKVVVKNKADYKFYFRVIGPVEDIKNTQMDRVDAAALSEELKSVIQAQSNGERDIAIGKLCADKSNMQKISYGSALFGMLGNVYNYGLTSGKGDEYSSQDITKKANETEKITIQRQYNVLNGYAFGTSGYPPVAGVCRHATNLVSDFLAKCGFEMNQVKGLGYATDDFSGHAIVKVKDPQSGNTYTLNWGEMTETEVPDFLSNYELTSNSIPAAGMIIQLYDASEEAKYAGFLRNNKGTVVARLLGTDDQHFDVSTYSYQEPGVAIEKAKTKIYVNTGKKKEIMNSFVLKMANSENELLTGEVNKGSGVGVQYGHKADVIYKNGLIINKGMTFSAAGYKFDETMNLIMLDPSDERQNIKYQGGALAGKGNIGIEKTIKENTTLFADASITGEGYLHTLKQKDLETTGTVDGIYYTTIKGGVSQQIDSKTTVLLTGQTNLSVLPDVRWNEKDFNKNLNLSADRTVINTQIFRKVTDDVGVTGGYEYAGNVEYRRHKANIDIASEKYMLNGGGGFTVIVDPATNDQQKVVNLYVIKKIELSDKVDLNANLGVTQNLNTNFRFYNVGVSIPLNR